jgi:predicted MPP superfamily phosphohydrolase
MRRHELMVTREDVAVAGLPPALAGLRVGVMTDLHRSQLVSHEDVARAVGMLMSEHPDLIVLGGDYVTWGDRRYVVPSAEALASLWAPHGVHAILGNHDDDHDMPLALAKNGVHVLKDARTRLTINHETIDLVGIRFDEAPGRHRGAPARRRADDRAARARSAAVDRSRRADIPLVLSGHTHGGRWCSRSSAPLPRAEISVVAGIGRREQTTMFEPRGGTIYLPVRINCPPEVAVLTLQPA